MADNGLMRNGRVMVILLALLSACLGGCHVAEAISYDIEDGSAYVGDKIADGGERVGGWMRDLNR